MIMKKIRQYQISKKAKISPSMLSEIINKKAKPSWNTAKRLAEATGSDPVDWMESPPETLRQIIQRINAQGIDNDM
jgi:transcriptional regulator with XRE-family HTH domain